MTPPPRCPRDLGVVSAHCGYITDPVVASVRTWSLKRTWFSRRARADGERLCRQRGRTAKPPDDDEWQPLGTLRPGTRRGADLDDSFHWRSTRTACSTALRRLPPTTRSPVYGSVDETTQRAAWSVGGQERGRVRGRDRQPHRKETPSCVPTTARTTPALTLVQVEQPAKASA